MFNLNQAFLLVQKWKPAPRALHKESRLKQKEYFNMPQIYVKLYGLILGPRVKKGYYQIWEANLQPLGAMFQHLLIS